MHNSSIIPHFLLYHVESSQNFFDYLFDLAESPPAAVISLWVPAAGGDYPCWLAL